MSERRYNRAVGGKYAHIQAAPGRHALCGFTPAGSWVHITPISLDAIQRPVCPECQRFAERERDGE